MKKGGKMNGSSFSLLKYDELDREMQHKLFHECMAMMRLEGEEVPIFGNALSNLLKDNTSETFAITEQTAPKELAGFIVISEKFLLGKPTNSLEINFVAVNPKFREKFKQQLRFHMFPFLIGTAACVAEQRKKTLAEGPNPTSQGKAALAKLHMNRGINKLDISRVLSVLRPEMANRLASHIVKRPKPNPKTRKIRRKIAI